VLSGFRLYKKINTIFDHTREEQMRELSNTKELPEINEDEKKGNQIFGVAAANVALTVISNIFYPPLLIATIPVTIFLCLHFFKTGFISLFKKRRLTIYLLDSIFIIWLIIAGYFFANAIMLLLFGIQLKVFSKLKGNSQKQITDVFGQHLDSVWILVGEDTEIEIPFERLKKGDIFIVNAGETIPADGIIKKGVALVDQHLLTGESQPAEKGTGNQVFASTLVLSGKIYAIVEKAGPETTASKIKEILNKTIDHKTSLELDVERLVDRSVFPVLAASTLVYLIRGSSGGLAILWASPGYTMRLTGPMSTISFLRMASQNGILVKDGRVMEKLAKIDTIVFDKTGTLTTEQLYLSNIYSFDSLSEEKILAYAAAAECRQKHPIAKAILTAAHKRKLILPKNIKDVSYEVGYGIKVKIAGQIVRVGSIRFMEAEDIHLSKKTEEIRKKCNYHGYSLIMISVDDKLAGAIELHQVIRSGAKYLLNKLAQSDISTYIISGDYEEPTRTLAKELGIDNYFANTLPEQKAELIEQLRKEGKTVCFVGDGINDSIALKKADVSISLRGASSAAIDSAQIVLMDENLKCLSSLFDIAVNFEANQKENLAISIIPGIITIGGVFLFSFGIYSAMLLYYLGLFVGMGNVIRTWAEIRVAEEYSEDK
jgi:Cu2+-exporting ATPase